MRGGREHNSMLVNPIEECLRDLGARVWVEYPVPAIGAVDLYAEHDANRIVVEAELTPRRVGRDLLKAEELGASVLLIVVPTSKVARVVREVVRDLASPPSPRIVVRPVGPAVQWVRGCFPLFSDAIPDRKTGTTNGGGGA